MCATAQDLVAIVFLTNLIFSMVCLAQPVVPTPTLVEQPKLGYPSSIGVATDDANRVFVTAEHDGAWDIQPTRDTTKLYWTFVTDYEIHEVHVAKLLAAPSTTGGNRNL